MKLASQINDPQTGRIEFDPDYRRTIPTYDNPEAYTFTLRQLRTLGAECMEETVRDFLLLCEMQARNEIGKSREQDTVEVRKIEKDIE